MRNIFLLNVIILLLTLDNDLYSNQDEDMVNSYKKNSVEFGFALELNHVEINYRRLWLPFLSTDMNFMPMQPGGINLGISIYPLSFLFFNCFYGYPVYNQYSTCGGPSFTANYDYSIKYGVQIPIIRKDEYFVSISNMNIWFVDRDYNYTSGFYSSEVEVEQKTRREIRKYNFFKLGIGVKF
ncbi:MAG: hypothetical protein Q8K98_07700 [Bacteroidota bacterium]|nr:hypothetical protein [Bacteroidota bacterium]